MVKVAEVVHSVPCVVAGLKVQQVEHPEGDASAGILVPIDTGVSGKSEVCCVFDLALSYADPRSAAGVAVFGLGLLALPLLAASHRQGADISMDDFRYARWRRTRSEPERPLAQQEMEQRLGSLDPASMAFEILRDETEGETDLFDEDIERLQGAVVSAQCAVRRLRRRAALAFMGLTPAASAEEVGSKYKRMALEMHPDKGGDAERFQQLTDMKERLTKSIQEEEEEEKNKKLDLEMEKLPPAARAKKMLHEAHQEAVKVWDAASKAQLEMDWERANAEPLLQRLRHFAEQHSSKLRLLPHGDKERAKSALAKFKFDGLEIIAAAALVDPSKTASIIATQINYKVVARSGSKEVAADAQALLHAVADVQRRVDGFLLNMQRSSVQVEPRAADTAAEGEPGAERGSEESLGAFAEEQKCSLSYPGTSIDMPPAPLRTEWDSAFSNPYSGAMSGDGEGIFCRACLRWICTRLYVHEAFLRHAEVVHPYPPLGWTGRVATTL